MECPKCDGKLLSQQVGDQSIPVCDKCAGMWLKYGQLPYVLAAWSRGMDIGEAAHNDLPKSSGPYLLNWDQVLGYCPLCASPAAMIPTFRDIGARIRVDYCQRGHGIWLDASEIRNIQSRLRNNKAEVCEDMLRRILTITEEAA
jgi:Zn-finger nucleic acid-binding protein